MPIATFHLGCAASAGRFMLTGSDPYYAMLAAKGSGGRVLADTYQALAPTFMATLFLLGAVHLALAWSVLDGRWRRASILWLIAASVTTLVICTIVAVAPSVPGIAVQLAALVVELIVLPFLTTWQRSNRRLFQHMEV